MSAKKNESQVLIFGFPESQKLKLFKVLSTFSWTYICANTFKEYKRIDNLYEFKISLFYIRDKSNETLNFINEYTKRSITALNCPRVCICENKSMTKDLVLRSVFDHVYFEEDLEGELNFLIQHYYSLTPTNEIPPEIDLNCSAILNSKVSWISGVELEIESNITFKNTTPIELIGDINYEYGLKSCRLVAYPGKNHKENLISVRIDGISKINLAKIDSLETIKDKKISILSLDDDPELCLLLKRKFEKEERFKYSFALNIKEFFKKIENNKYDLYFIDYNLGESFKGVEVVKFLRKEYGENILIFMLSKSDLKDDLPNTFEYGFNDYFFKPINMKQVKAKLSYFLKLDDSLPPLKMPPSPLSQIKLKCNMQIISFNEFTCILKVYFDIKTMEQFHIESFLINGLAVEVRVTNIIDREKNFNIIEAEYITKSKKLTSTIRICTSSKERESNEN